MGKLGEHWILKLLARVGGIATFKAQDLDSTGCDLSIRATSSIKAKTRAKGHQGASPGLEALRVPPVLNEEPGVMRLVRA